MDINENTIPLYLKHRQADIAHFAPDAQLVAQQIGDGNLNFIFRVFDAAQPSHSLILKHAPPYVKILGPAYPLTAQRLTYEFRMLDLYHRLATRSVPTPLFFDQENAVLLIEDLRDHALLRDELIAGRVNQTLAEQVGRFLGRIHRKTYPDIELKTEAYKRNTNSKNRYQNCFENAEMRALTADYVFTFPFIEHETNFYSKGLEPFVAQLKTDEDFLKHAHHLKNLFCNAQQAVIHGDLHTGSVMVQGDSPKFIDAEFACYGPVAFDLGLYWANYYLSYFSHTDKPIIQAQLKMAIEHTWNGYATEFKIRKAPTLLQIFQDTVGFAGMEILRRIIGAAHVKDIEAIVDAKRKLLVETFALNFGTTLVKQHRNIQTLTELHAKLENSMISRSHALHSSTL